MSPDLGSAEDPIEMCSATLCWVLVVVLMISVDGRVWPAQQAEDAGLGTEKCPWWLACAAVLRIAASSAKRPAIITLMRELNPLDYAYSELNLHYLGT